MSYQNIQFIAYVIDTRAVNNQDGVPSVYLGLENPADDIRARCTLLLRAIQTANANLTRTSPPQAPGTTLTVFMAPEFFFRGSTGAYDMDSVQLAIAQLQQMVTADEWTDWLFAFGTIVGMSTTDAPQRLSNNGSPSAPTEAYNFTLLLQGGSGNPGNLSAKVVMKELMSDKDFIGDATSPNGVLLGDVTYLDSGSSGPGKERQIVNYDGAGIFSLDDITWGVDICLDHARGRLQKSPQLPGENTVQVQLIPSCGMNIKQAQVIAGDQGYVFSCDGSVFGSNLMRVEAGGVTLTPMSKIGSFPVADDLLDSDNSPPAQIAIGQLYQGGAGMIDLYPGQPIPPTTTVAGKIVPLNWQITDDYLLTFNLIYDQQGIYQTCLCQINGNNANVKDLNYFLPLVLRTSDSSGKKINIDARIRGGSLGYEYTLWCKINLPSLIFEGVAAQFFNDMKNGDPTTCWQAI